MFTNTVRKRFKPQLTVIKNVINDLKDVRDKITGKDDEMVPPRRMHFVGAGDYKKVGEHFRQIFIEIGGLKPTDHILDVGSGNGRMAVPLTNYLSRNSKYEGFDIVKEGVDWCKENISIKFPNFRFRHANIYNKCYNPAGTLHPNNFVFPYADNSFDFIFLTSVFTHMMPDEMDRYFSEISRVLSKGGTCLITFFLLNEKCQEGIAAGKSTLTFPFGYNSNCFYEHKELPENVVAYDEQFIKQCYSRHLLTIKDSIYYGSWSGRENTCSFQDVIVAYK